ncbi:MAG TPA: DUF488 domain-containing protein [Vicinamibacterales bacterium]|nr:DUF488 domain-containing protein [Vicinamibacterales bacterium]
MTAAPGILYTIGHSTHAADAFVALLQAHGVRQLADVRRFPASRRHPQFHKDALAASLADVGIEYRHFPELGGMRRPRSDSVNTAWQQSGFRGYADYMQTPAFEAGLEALLSFAAEGPTAVMCAEAVWWRCHRKLLADAVLARGVPVRHILTAAEPKLHELSDFASVKQGKVTYPGLL